MHWFAPEPNQSKFSYFYGRLDNSRVRLLICKIVCNHPFQIMYGWINIMDTFYILYVYDVASWKQYNDFIDHYIGTDSKINLKPFAKSKSA